MLFLRQGYVKVIVLAGVCFVQLHTARPWREILPRVAQKVRQLLAVQKQHVDGERLFRLHGIAPDEVGCPDNYSFLVRYFNLINTMQHAQDNEGTQAFRHLRRLLLNADVPLWQITTKQFEYCLAEVLQELETHFFAYLRDHVCAPSSVQLQSQYEEELADMLTAMSCFSGNKQEIRHLAPQAFSPWFQSAAVKTKLHNWFLNKGRFTKLYRDMFQFAGGVSENKAEDFYAQWYNRKWTGCTSLCTKEDEEKFCLACLEILHFRRVQKKDVYISLSREHNQDLLHKVVEAVEEHFGVVLERRHSDAFITVFGLFIRHLLAN